MSSALYVRMTELVEVLGEVDALRLATVHGGTRFYVPRHFTTNSAIVTAIGLAAAAKLSRHFADGLTGGLWIEIPRGGTGHRLDYRERLLKEAANPDLSENEVARRLGVHARTVRRARAKLLEENRLPGHVSGAHALG